MKKTLHTRWNIPIDCPQVAHNALYTLLGTDAKPVSDITILLKTIDSIVTQAATNTDYDALTEAFYTQHGILKELTRQLPDAGTRINPAINAMEHAQDRSLLNNLILVNHTEPDNTHAHQAFEYLEHSYTASTISLQKNYSILAHKTYAAMRAHGQTTIAQLPNLACSYTRTDQIQLHEKIVDLVTQTLSLKDALYQKHLNGLYRYDEACKTLTALDTTLAAIKKAHILNTQGLVTQAYAELDPAKYTNYFDAITAAENACALASGALLLALQETQQQAPSDNMPVQTPDVQSSMPMPPEPDFDPEKNTKTADSIHKISLAEYDPSLGDLKKLEEAANMFKNNASAIAKDGPLTKLLEGGKTESSICIICVIFHL